MKIPFFLLVSISLVACNSLKSIKSAFVSLSPYERYVRSLEKAELLNASMTQGWLLAGKKIFDDSVFVQLPFAESGYFQASKPEARSYRFKVKDGQVITIDGAFKTEENAKIFMDLFTWDDDAWEMVSHADSTFTLTHEFSRNAECVVRLQPELLINAYYAVNISITPVLVNPVFGASNKSIQSFYGASRDGGKRSHEGVDIFANKGTPVIAPTDGFITRVGVNTLGGKVVWMKDNKRGHSYYFAHLDSQMVQPGLHVRQGHVLGVVGNTGNARRTPPHLHFGIYQSGSKDPLYYIHQVESAMETLPIDTGFQQQPFKVHPRKVKLMAGPSVKHEVKTYLDKETYLTVIGQSHEWFRIALPDHTEGFILKKHVAPITKGTFTTLDSATVLLSEIRMDAVPVALLKEDTSVEVLAHFKNFNFVRTENGTAGWLYN